MIEIKKGLKFKQLSTGDTEYILDKLVDNSVTVNTIEGEYKDVFNIEDVKGAFNSGNWIESISPEIIPVTETKIDSSLDTITIRDKDFSIELDKLLTYLESTYNDKYEGEDKVIISKSILLSKDGKSANMFSASKYLQRYMSVGFNKSESKEDLYKSIHYIIFELQRLTKHGL